MKKACKNCKSFVDGNECPVCKGNSFSNVWQGRITILEQSKSDIAKKMELNDKGEYEIKVR